MGAARLPAAGRPPSRRHLAELLFADADDPLGALRWTLAELRRALGAPGLFGGDPVANGLAPGLEADVLMLAAEPADPASLLGSRASCWRASGSRPARRSSPGWWWSGTGSRRWSRPGCAMPPWGCWPAAGDRPAALRQVAVCEDTLRRELGVEPSPALRDAADASAGAPAGLPVSGRAAVASQLDAGRAAIAAGAVQAGIDSLRRAVAVADACADPALQGRPWPPWAARWSTPSGAATRRARWSCTRPSAWPPWPGTGRWRSPPTGSWGSSRCRPAGARPPRPGWPGPRRWPTPTSSSPRSSGCGA